MDDASAEPDDRDGPDPGPRSALEGPELVTDELWSAVAPLLPAPDAGPLRPGRVRLPERAVLNGVLLVLTTGRGWAALPSALGYGSGIACWRRREEWRDAGCWPAINATVIAYFERVGSTAEADALRRAEAPAHRVPQAEPRSDADE